MPFLIVYLVGGFYGFVLGGNFSRVGIPTVGASGAILASVCRFAGTELIWRQEGCMAVDLIMHWRFYDRPVAKVCFLGPGHSHPNGYAGHDVCAGVRDRHRHGIHVRPRAGPIVAASRIAGWWRLTR